MLLTEDSFQTPTLSPMAPTAATTSNALASAGSGLENLLKLAVGGYTSILNAKTAATQAKQNIADANRTGVPNATDAAGSGSGFNSKTVILGAVVLAAVVAAVAIFRPSKA